MERRQCADRGGRCRDGTSHEEGGDGYCGRQDFFHHRPSIAHHHAKNVRGGSATVRLAYARRVESEHEATYAQPRYHRCKLFLKLKRWTSGRDGRARLRG